MKTVFLFVYAFDAMSLMPTFSLDLCMGTILYFLEIAKVLNLQELFIVKPLSSHRLASIIKYLNVFQKL